ncbi:MAG: hypothetical protein ABIA63_09475, partial [bacterium]
GIKALDNFSKPVLIKNIFQESDNSGKSFEIFFSENIQYLGLGARLKYNSGFILHAGALLGTFRERGLTSGVYLDTVRKDITDGFSPFFADWQIVGRMSFPIIFTMTSSEMYRNFLLLKNRKVIKRDIEEILDKSFKKSEESEGSSQSDERERLMEIEKRRKRILEEDSVE